jgi:PIN domain nuclease of toxin-antitoxin system
MDYQIITLETDDAIGYLLLKESTHNDPFDRMLIQQSINRNMVMIRNLKNLFPMD